MANSTLHPGNPSEAIVRLRDAAIRDMDKPQLNVKSVRAPSFDVDHEVINPDTSREFPEFHGTNNPDVGNGPGPIG